MGTPKEPKPAKYFVALLLSDANLLTGVEKELPALFGAVDGRSELTPWAASKFYEQEMGLSLQRRFLSFAALRSPVELVALKLRTQQIEESYRSAPFILNGCAKRAERISISVSRFPPPSSLR
jgi:hypothetical protein